MKIFCTSILVFLFILMTPVHSQSPFDFDDVWVVTAPFELRSVTLTVSVQNEHFDFGDDLNSIVVGPVSAENKTPLNLNIRTVSTGPISVENQSPVQLNIRNVQEGPIGVQNNAGSSK